MGSKRNVLIVIGILIVLAFGIYLSVTFGRSSTSSSITTAKVHVVAAEDFYGNIAQQLGGSDVSVTSILSDPNVDPHEYESDVQDGIAITNANIVIENGLEYDAWMDKLIAAAPNQNRIEIIAGNVAPDALPDNPHVWYGIDNIQTIANTIAAALEKTDPADATTYEANLATFQNSLLPIQQKMAEIKSRYAGTPVGLTETIYLYQTQPLGLNVRTPFDFEKAIAEGNDPSAQSVDTTDSQVNDKSIKVLIYNSQTVTPITSNLQAAAQKNAIPVIPVTETMPTSDTYQSWMLDELNILEQGLATATGH